jgi:DNA-binding NarL/FixJ family response regulator
MFREGLRMLVASHRDMDVVGEAEDGARAIALARQLRPDVIVIDISMPELDGVRATQALRDELPEIGVLVLTRHTDGGYVERLLRAGASGYVVKGSASEELVRAIRAVAGGQTYLDPAMAAQAIDRMGPPTPAQHLWPGEILSVREQDVLRLVATGLVSREIALRLAVSIKTVETHKANAMRKLRMKSRVDIVRYAMLRGWLADV